METIDTNLDKESYVTSTKEFVASLSDEERIEGIKLVLLSIIADGITTLIENQKEG